MMRFHGISLFMIISFALGPNGSAGVNLVKKSPATSCKESATADFVKKFDPDSAAENELRRFQDIERYCAELKIDPALSQKTKAAYGRLLYRVSERSFLENETSGAWAQLVEYGGRSGLTEKEIEKRLSGHLAEEKSKCSGADQRSKLPPVWNQGQSGWCYAHAAAAMASFYAKRPISPEGTAINAILNGNSGWGGGGTFKDAFDISEKAGFCPVEGFPRIAEIQESGAMLNMESIEEIRRLAKNPAKSAMEPGRPCPRGGEFDSKMAVKLGIDTDQFAEVLRQSSQDNAVTKLLQGKCEPKIHTGMKIESYSIKVPGVKTDWASYQEQSDYAKIDRMDVKEKLQKALADNQVVGFGTSELLGVKGGHAMLIIGQEWNEKLHECRVLIRNSFGPKKCLPDLDVGQECDHQGNYWVPVRDVLNHMNTFSFARPNR